MKVTYNAELDTLHILFNNAPIMDSEQHSSLLTLDYDQHGRLVGLELASASEHLSRPYPADLVETLSIPNGMEAESVAS